MSRTETMIPDLPKGVSPEDTLEFYSNLWSNLESQSTGHVYWHTHTKNPSTCWICDMYALVSKMMDLYDGLLTKSTVDNEINLSSETDSELKANFDSDDAVEEEQMLENINEPEYELDEDEH